MRDFGITAWGAYVPRQRIQRATIASAHAWMSPALKGLAKGRRAYCSWDEDVVTMAVEAARDCLSGRDLDQSSYLLLASTTAPFADLQSSAVVATALRLPETTRSTDVGGSQRAAVTALLGALEAGGEGGLVTASERPRAKPASVQEMQYGAGAAAFALGDDRVAARLVGHASATALFVDHFRAAGAAYDYYWEERWVRDEGYLKIATKAVGKALAAAGLGGAAVDHFILPSPMRDAAAAVARSAGVAATAVADPLDQDCGYAGAAHGLLMLANVLDRAEPGEIILLAGFGQGCDVLVLQTTDAIIEARPKAGVAATLAVGIDNDSYLRMASFYDEIAPDWGMRSERDGKTALTEQYRSADSIGGFTAGRCGACGIVQFPQLAYCVGCHARATEFTPVCLADEPAHVMTYTADALAYHPAPPLYVGFVQFDNGARLLMEFVDVNPAAFDVGAPLRMAFRIKERDRQRGYDRYFWKAAPAAT
jgi:3-hydroxy-3-methylglutaryl CoA synthase